MTFKKTVTHYSLGTDKYSQMKQKIVIICGPTGIGKTSVAIDLATSVSGEIVSADSMQLYRLMEIGTATPNADELAAVPHHLINIADPDEAFDAAKFAAAAHAAIDDITRRGLLPFVVGGTGLYIKALMHGLFRARPADPEVLAHLKQEVAKKGSGNLHERLTALDPAAAGKIHPNDAFRIVRALEVVTSTGRPASVHRRAHGFSESHYDALKIGLTMNRDDLYDRINRRVEIMLASGLLEEVKALIAAGYSPSLKAMQSIGYRHMAEFLKGEKGWEDAVETLKRDTRRYAKRQFTWFKADPDIQWFQPEDIRTLTSLVKQFLATV